MSDTEHAFMAKLGSQAADHAAYGPNTPSEIDTLRELNAELLEALKAIIDTSQASPSEWVRACSLAAAAISKAEGRT